jgi:hypothetical protein
MRRFQTWILGVPLEVLQEKHRVGLELHHFWGAEFQELEMFGWIKLEQSCRTWSGVVPNRP